MENGDPKRRRKWKGKEVLTPANAEIIGKITGKFNSHPKVKKIMESAIKLSVPVLVEFHQGNNWRDMERC